MTHSTNGSSYKNSSGDEIANVNLRRHRTCRGQRL